ncbi:hypothetical protein LMG28138_04669 [Pararobbsia alpina]|uniref:Uncharacterized protein n=1 Tax=Pararobbsia alpina TaxID=621374 RepID=A0A6S7C202_9BURK|nr:hypothetical protein LMG28138_04669 [Pararobbsia alpina]
MTRKIAAPPRYPLAGRSPGRRSDADFNPLLSAWGIPTQPPHSSKAPDCVATQEIASPWAALMSPESPAT